MTIFQNLGVGFAVTSSAEEVSILSDKIVQKLTLLLWWILCRNAEEYPMFDKI